MPITSSDLPLDALYTGLNVVFQDAYRSSVDSGLRSRISTQIPTNSDSEDYAWLGGVPGVREFIGERQVRDLSAFSYSIANKVWENTISVDRSAIDHDKYGLIKTRVQELAAAQARFQDQLVFEILAGGFTAACYDGKYFFDTTHAGGSNKGTDALTAASLSAAITAMMKLTDDQGTNLGVRPDTLVVPPDLQWTARELLESRYYPEKLTSTDTQKLAVNVLAGSLDLVVSPYLSDTNNWYVLCTGRVIKPLIFQLDAPVEFQALEKESESGFMRGQYLYGTYARYNAGYGLWQYAFGSLVG